MKNTTLGLKNEFFQPPASKIVNTFQDLHLFITNC